MNTILVDIMEKSLLVTLVIGTLLTLRHMFDEEEFSLSDAIKDLVTASIAFGIFFFVGKTEIDLVDVFVAIGGGLMVGFITSAAVKMIYKKPQWITKGSAVFLVVWLLVFTLSQISEQIFEQVEWWWVFLAIFALSVNAGGLANLLMRQKKL